MVFDFIDLLLSLPYLYPTPDVVVCLLKPYTLKNVCIDVKFTYVSY